MAPLSGCSPAPTCALEMGFKGAPAPLIPPCTVQNLQMGSQNHSQGFPLCTPPSLHCLYRLVISVSPLDGELQRAGATSQPFLVPQPLPRVYTQQSGHLVKVLMS